MRVTQGVADAAAVDLAMQKGVNYPRGPLAWADALGVGHVRDVLAHLAAHYGEDRYRLSPLIAAPRADGAAAPWVSIIRRCRRPRRRRSPSASPQAMFARDRRAQALGMRSSASRPATPSSR